VCVCVCVCVCVDEYLHRRSEQAGDVCVCVYKHTRRSLVRPAGA
jgi:hypothetical protein